MLFNDTVEADYISRQKRFDLRIINISLSLISFPRLTRHGQHLLSNISVQFPVFERRWELVTFLVLKPNSSDPREALDQLVRLGG